MFDIVTRAQAVLLRSLGEALAVVQEQTGISQQVRILQNNARARRWQPGTPLTSAHVADAPRTGRPVRITQRVEQAVVDAVTKDRYGREKTLVQLGAQFQISAQSVFRILKKKHFRKTKPTRKPGLTKDMRTARYLFAQRYQQWTLEDWKSVIPNLISF